MVESKKLLQQDHTEVSNGLLLLIAQSQQRLEQGRPQPILAPVQFATFSAPGLARWINGLWFSSLALSLSAALVAMLAKEWLTAYNTSRPRSAYTYAHLRQSRFNALFKWRALHIVTLLPSILHLALLLFSIGLVLYLVILDKIVAIVVGVIAGGTLLFYMVTAVLGAIYEFCPFVTQISKYIKQILMFCSGDWMVAKAHSSKQDNHFSENTTTNDLQALTWLAEHARDPAARDCSYQALAGLHLAAPECTRAVSHSYPNAPSTNAEIKSEGHFGILKTPENSDVCFNQCELVRHLFESLCVSLSQILI